MLRTDLISVFLKWKIYVSIVKYTKKKDRNGSKMLNWGKSAYIDSKIMMEKA